MINIPLLRLRSLQIFLLMGLFTVTGFAQGEYSAHNEGWMVNVEEAYAESEKTGKPIMANFTGSDWCGWCKRLTANVFSKQEFKEWADDNVVLLELDFPRRTNIPDEIKAQNYGLQKAFKVTGYPTVWVFYLEKDKDKDQMNIHALGKTGYKNTVKEFTNDVEQMLAAAAGS